jgi:hypothetical protein
MKISFVSGHLAAALMFIQVLLWTALKSTEFPSIHHRKAAGNELFQALVSLSGEKIAPRKLKLPKTHT